MAQEAKRKLYLGVGVLYRLTAFMELFKLRSGDSVLFFKIFTERRDGVKTRLLCHFLYTEICVSQQSFRMFQPP